MKDISPARIAAFEILLRIEKERAFSSALLPFYEEELTQKDRALCHELTLGVLRRKLFLDRIIQKLTKKNLDKFDIEVVIALRLGLYQIKFLDKIPAYSSINESVNLTYRAKKRSASGLVNAVLRRTSRESIDLSFTDNVERISIETSHPRWLIENWIRQFGIKQAEEICKVNNVAPKSFFRFTARFYTKEKEDQQQILKLIEQFEVTRSDLVDGCFRVEKSSEILRDLASSGDIYFQEEGSQMVADICDLKRSERFIDVCAAPGSKITFVCSKLDPANSRLIVAGDFYEQRIRKLQENCKNQGADSVRFIRYDAGTTLPFADESFDVVLLDAPCSGTGTIRNNPEIRYLLAEKDLDELPEKQLKFLWNASKLVKRSGRLIYSTCSLETQENEDVIEKFLEDDSGFEIDATALPEKFRMENGFMRTFSFRDGTDGFFVAVLRRC